MTAVANYAYEISPRPAELGGGWRLRLLVNGEEVGGGVFPPEHDGANATVEAFQHALNEAFAWRNSR
jgi:hypothetical protein